MDYEAEHIKGAINIPMEVLRQKYDELDRAKSYITYCSINDSRGMTSAFLLKNHGFNAKCLRGGEKLDGTSRESRRWLAHARTRMNEKNQRSNH